MKIDRQGNIEREIECHRKRHTEKNQKIYTNKEIEREKKSNRYEYETDKDRQRVRDRKIKTERVNEREREKHVCIENKKTIEWL